MHAKYIIVPTLPPGESVDIFIFETFAFLIFLCVVALFISPLYSKTFLDGVKSNDLALYTVSNIHFLARVMSFSWN